MAITNSETKYDQMPRENTFAQRFGSSLKFGIVAVCPCYVAIVARINKKKRKKIMKLSARPGRITLRRVTIRGIRATMHNDRVSPTARLLVEEYGLVLSASTAARLLGYRIEALRQARLRKQLPFRMFEIAGRRGYFASSTDVADWLDQMTRQPAAKL